MKNIYYAPARQDVYKAYHPFAYSEDTTHVYGNMTPRFDKHSNVKDANIGGMIWFGLQAYLMETVEAWKEFFELPKPKAVRKYLRIVSHTLSKEVKAPHLEALHDLGYLPLSIRALPEGVIVPYGVPAMTLVNTVPGFGWLTNSIESDESSELWGMCTSATTALAYRKRFEASKMPKELIKYMGHDFSYRGMLGRDASGKSGAGHLLSFLGSDNFPAGMFLEEYYFADFEGDKQIMSSIDATEHSVACSNILAINADFQAYGVHKGRTEQQWIDYLRGDEEYAYQHQISTLELSEVIFAHRLLTEVTPTGGLSFVADSFDFFAFIQKGLPLLKRFIMARDGIFVVRPDSGEPVNILCGYTSITLEELEDKMDECTEVHELVELEEEYELVVRNGVYYNYNIEFRGGYGDGYFHGEYIDIRTAMPTVEARGLFEALWDLFGGTILEDGTRALDTHIGAIYGDSITLKRQDEILNRLEKAQFLPTACLGIGSFTYQYVTRDTHGTAIKATDIQLGEGNHLAISKDPVTDRSKASAKGLLCVTQGTSGKYVLHTDVTPEFEASDENCLKEVFRDGKLLITTSLEEIRARIDANFE